MVTEASGDPFFKCTHNQKVAIILPGDTALAAKRRRGSRKKVWGGVPGLGVEVVCGQAGRAVMVIKSDVSFAVPLMD